MAFTAADVPDQSGRCILVTDANTGIGFEAARVLAAKGARVLLGCRDKARAGAAMTRIVRETPRADLAFVALDQADLASLREAAEQVRTESRLDVLLNNAGVIMPPLGRTAQGFETQFGVNHLATFALTALLLPKLAEQKESRIVVTSSLAHQRGKMDWDDLNSERSYGRSKRYSDSKLANLLFVHELDRRLRAAGSPVIAVACHPGIAKTELGRHTGPFRIFFKPIGLILNTAERGAWPALQAATWLGAKGGDYFGPQAMGEMKGASGPARRGAHASDDAAARRLWARLIELTGIDPGLAPA